MTDICYLNIEAGQTNAILFIDRKKAFDTIDQEILLSKLELYGFKGASLNIFCNITAQVTVINNVNSETSLNFSLNHDLDNLKVWLDSNGLRVRVRV